MEYEDSRVAGNSNQVQQGFHNHKRFHKFYNDPAAVSQAGSLCAVGNPGGNVQYDGNSLNALGAAPNAHIGNDPNQPLNKDILTWTFTHELGHVLNLSQQEGQPSVMAGASGGSNCIDALTNYRDGEMTIQQSDVINAAYCSNRTVLIADSPNGNGETGSGLGVPNGECWDAYWVTVIYEYSFEYEEWMVVDEIWDYLFTTCDYIPYPN